MVFFRNLKIHEKDSIPLPFPKRRQCNFIYKQEANWPHRSPEKTVQINDYIITLFKRRKTPLSTF